MTSTLGKIGMIGLAVLLCVGACAAVPAVEAGPLPPFGGDHGQHFCVGIDGVPVPTASSRVCLPV